MSNYRTHAQREFRAAGWVDETGKWKDGMQAAICAHVVALLDLFAGEGHSGSSAPYAIGLFEKLAKFEPITPLTGDDSEWVEVAKGQFQNARCGHVFKDVGRFDGRPYDIQAVVFYEWYERPLDPGEPGYPGTIKDKSHFTNSDSHQPISFPYTPKTEYREVNRA